MTDRFTSERVKSLGGYTFAQLDELKAAVARRHTVIDMGVGDPDLPPPPVVQGALVAALSPTQNHRYPSYQGERFLRESIARFFLNRYRVKLDPDENILVLVGSKEGIFHLPLAVLNPGDVGAYTSPGYPVYRAGILCAGATPAEIPLAEERSFVFDPKEVPKGTRLLFVNYPNNPTTAVVGVDFWRALVDEAHRRGFIIANDAAYAEIYFNEPPRSILEVPGAGDVAVEFHSLSKTFSMSGWRIGFVVGNSNVVAALGALKKHVDSGVFKPIQSAAKSALDAYWELSGSLRKIYRRRVETWISALRRAGIAAYNFGATFYVWAKVPPRFQSSQEFAKTLLEKAGIVCMPGVSMGKAGEGFVRFSLTLPDEKLEEATRRIETIRSC